MKNKDIAKICKQNKTIVVITDADGTQWAGDGAAMFPLLKMPTLDEEGFYAVFDINDKQAAGYDFKIMNFMGGMSLDDTTPEENELKRIPIKICCEGRELEPVITSQGLAFIDNDYLKICDGSYMKVFERFKENGELYFAVKNGLMIIGIIAPYKIHDSSAEIIRILSRQLEIDKLNRAVETQ